MANQNVKASVKFCGNARVEVTTSVRRNDLSPVHKLSYILDFSKMSESWLYEQAARNSIIRVATQLRHLSEEELTAMEGDNTVIDFANMEDQIASKKGVGANSAKEVAKAREEKEVVAKQLLESVKMLISAGVDAKIIAEKTTIPVEQINALQAQINPKNEAIQNNKPTVKVRQKVA